MGFYGLAGLSGMIAVLAAVAAPMLAAAQVTGDLRLTRESGANASLTGHFCAPPAVTGAGGRPDLRVEGATAVAVTQLFELSRAERAGLPVMSRDCGAADRMFLVSQRLPVPVGAVAQVALTGRDGTPHRLPLRRNDRPGGQRHGIVYSLDHCLVSDTRHNVAPGQKIHDVTRILQQPADRREWGPVRWNHWVARPLDGYYCLTDNPRLARKHAFLLSVMGVDFVILDMTNMGLAATRDRPGSYSAEFRSKIARPVATLLAEWRALSAGPRPAHVPRIVPWAGLFLETRKERIAPERSIGRYLVRDFLPLLQGAGLGLHPGGGDKPLLLVKMNASPRFNPNRAAEAMAALGIGRHFTTRTMWADRDKLERRLGDRQKRHAGLSGPDNFWSFLEPCRMSGGSIAPGCAQRAGSREQISVSAGYPSGTFISLEGQTHRRRGRTLYQQFQKVFADGGRTPYVVWSVWNPWTNPRQCPTTGGNSPHGKGPPLVWNDHASHAARRCADGRAFYPGGVPAFLDNYDLERSKIIEPDPVWGDCYMSLGREMIFAAREGRRDLDPGVKARFGACGGVGFDLRR